jgi:zinc D-Ala-D-Ala carboxypeptidase
MSKEVFDFFKLSDNFKLGEFKVSSTCPGLAKKIKFSVEDYYSLKLLCFECIQPIRDRFGPIKILSGKRSEELNKAVKGSKFSDHLTSNAADISCLNFSENDVFRWIVNESTIPYRQVILYPASRFIHISNNVFFKDLKHEALVCDGNEYFSAKEYFENEK